MSVEGPVRSKMMPPAVAIRTYTGHKAFYDGSRHELAVLLGEPGWRLTDEEPMVIIWFQNSFAIHRLSS